MKDEDFQERLKNVGRNDQCPCGSGKKYKKCHRIEDDMAQQKVLQKIKEEAVVDADAAAVTEKKENNASFFNNDVRSKLKQGNTVARRNAPRRQAGK